MLSEVLGGGQTAVMAEKLQFETQQAVYSGAFYGGTSLDRTTFDLVVVPTPGVSLEEAEAAMDQVLVEFLEEGVDEAHLERIKTQIRASEIYARDDVEGLANRYGRSLTQGLTVQDVQDWPNVLQAVTAEDIMAAARKVLNPKTSVTGYLMAEEG